MEHFMEILPTLHDSLTAWSLNKLDDTDLLEVTFVRNSQFDVNKS